MADHHTNDFFCDICVRFGHPNLRTCPDCCGMEAIDDEEESYRLDYIDDEVSTLPSRWGKIVARARPVTQLHLWLTCMFAAIAWWLR